MALVDLAIPVALLGALGVELGLGLFVLERGEGRAAPRLLGAFMLLHPSTFGVIVVWNLSRVLYGQNLADSTIGLTLVLMVFLPALLLSFALAYPTLHPAIRSKRPVLLAPLIPPLGLVGILVLEPEVILLGFGPGNAPVALFVFLGYLLVGAVVAAGLFWRRAKRAETDLKRRRLMYMAKVIAVPTAVAGAAAALVFLILQISGPFEPLGLVVFSTLTLLPAFGLGYGVLKYQVLDIDLKVKWGIKQSTVAGAFIAVFFVASEGAQVLLAGFAQSEILGVVAAGALVFLLSPLQRFAERVSDTAMPDVEDTAEHRSERKEEVYRATLEEVMADDRMSAKDRRVLLSLRENLGLDSEEADRLEREVLDSLDEEPA